jgi:hypothetical protein
MLESSTFGARFIIAATAGCTAIILFFILFAAGPFRIEGDIAYVAKAAQQYVAHVSRFNELRLVDPCDLSQDVDTWVFWWPPAICALFIGLLSLGVKIDIAGRTIMLAAALVGACGWAAVAAKLFSKRAALVLSCLPALLYVINSEMYDRFSSGDPLVFAAAPWLFVIALRLFESPNSRRSDYEFIVLGFSCGTLYWIKYSALFVAAAILASTGLILIESDRSLRRLASIAAAAIAFLLPVAALWSLNHIQGGDFLQSSISAGVRADHLVDHLVRAAAMTVWSIDAGLARLFSDDHIFSFLIRGAAVTLAASLLISAWRGWGTGPSLLAGFVVLIPLTGLGYLTWAAGYSFLLDASRHAGAYWILLQIIMVGVLLGDVEKPIRQIKRLRFLIAALFLITAPFAAYSTSSALHNSISNLRSDSDVLTGLNYPTLSKFNSGAFAKQIRDQLKPDDVIVPASYWLGMDLWLAFDQRLLPLTNFYQPLVATHGRYGADYSGTESFLTRTPLRIVIISTDPYSEPHQDEWTKQIKKRFVQAGDWIELKTFNGNKASVWATMLTPSSNDRQKLRESCYRPHKTE